MKSKEPRSTFKASWSTLRDSGSKPWMVPETFITQASISSTSMSSTNSATVMDGPNSRLDSLITRREEDQLNRSAQRIELDNWNSGRDENDNQEISSTCIQDVKHGTNANNNSILKLKEQPSIDKEVRKSEVTISGKKNCTELPTVSAESLQENTTFIKKEILDFVGFSNICNQRQRMCRHRGASLRILVLGEKGVGKSTIISSLLSDSSLQSSKQHNQFREVSATIKESNLNINVSAFEFPGFGEKLENGNMMDPPLRFLEERLDTHFEGEMKAVREGESERRVEVCLYLLAPTGHSLKKYDIEALKRLQELVNIIPCVAKADSFTKEELKDFKQSIRHQLRQNKIYPFTFSDAAQSLPFSLIGSNTKIQDSCGKTFRGRKYPWGVVNIENEDHCDFTSLYRVLFITGRDELIQQTNTSLYESYRAKKLSFLAAIDETMVSIRNKNPLAVLEEESREHFRKLERMEREMEDVFNKKLALKLKKLKDTQECLMEEAERSQKNLEKMKQELIAARENHEKDKSDILAENLSPSHSNKSEISVSSSNSRKIFRFNFDQIKLK